MSRIPVHTVQSAPEGSRDALTVLEAKLGEGRGPALRADIGDDVSSGPTICSTPWGGGCHRLMNQLDREGVAYISVDIERDPAAAEFVMGVNGGNQTVPTVVLPDGKVLTNPSAKDVLAHLAI